MQWVALKEMNLKFRGLNFLNLTDLCLRETLLLWYGKRKINCLLLWRKTISIQQGFCYANILEKIIQNKGSFRFLCSQARRDRWRIVFQYCKATRHSTACLERTMQWWTEASSGNQHCPTSNWITLKEDPSAPVKPSHDFFCSWNLATILWRAWRQSHPESYFQIPNPQKLWRIKILFL